ncbi:MAG: primosomal protein N' [Phycisphaerales bacterium]|nr:primosomal protein N' [Phycisphaerales bacterium]
MESHKRYYADIILPLYLPKNYTWEIPEHLISKIQIGCRVEVPLKRKLYTGIVRQMHENKPLTFAPKPIIKVLDDHPLIHNLQLKLWWWLAYYYLSSEGEVMNLAIPSLLKLSSEPRLILIEPLTIDPLTLHEKEYLIYEALTIAKELNFQEIKDIIQDDNITPVINSLLKSKIVQKVEALEDRYQPLTALMISLHPTYSTPEGLTMLMGSNLLTEKQQRIVFAYIQLAKNKAGIRQELLIQKAETTHSTVHKLIEKNIFISTQQPISRLKEIPIKNDTQDYLLTSAQKTAYEQINETFKNKMVCLLHGVTASGKTALYLKLISERIAHGQVTLYLVPEISLTTQLINKLESCFGGHVIVYHSKLNAQERVEIWHEVLSKRKLVILGARSAIFLPFSSLDFIIIDEEHEPSYKQKDFSPKYHARDVSIYYASLSKAKVLLGSATPSLESYYNTQINKYGLVNLFERYGQVNLPPINTINLKQIVSKKKDDFIITPQLLNSIQASLHAKRQVLLFQNRRGYAPHIYCKSCDWIPKCTQCNVSLTYHKQYGKLFCHYCGSKYEQPTVCPSCGNYQFIQHKSGTEKVEELLSTLLPKARIMRMDMDSIKGKYEHEQLIKKFEAQEVDILVGTQIIVKGLDFAHVNLVGVIDGDSLLHHLDFRVNERAFQLLEQVSGRAGRRQEQGEVLLQIKQVDHPLLNFLLQHDYKSFYNWELNSRKDYGYPPIGKLINITVKHKNNLIAQDGINQLKQLLQTKYLQYLLGPSQPYIDKIRNEHIWELLFKLPNNLSFIQQVKQDIFLAMATIKQDRKFTTLAIQLNVDPL